MKRIENKSFISLFVYFLLTIPAFVLAILAFSMSVMGLGMIAFVPGSIAVLLALIAYLVFKFKKRFTWIIGSVALIALLFTGFRTLIFEPKIADDANTNSETLVTEEEIGSDLSEAFGDAEFGEEEANPAQSGEKIYAAHCARCHQADGKGIPDKYPPLAKSDYMESRLASISAVINGMSGENAINNQIYKSSMPKPDLNNQELVAVINCVFSSWGNDIQPTTLGEVEKIKAISK